MRAVDCIADRNVSTAETSTNPSITANSTDPFHAPQRSILLTIDDVAALCGCSCSTIRRLIDAGKFPEGELLTPGIRRWHREVAEAAALVDSAAVAALLRVSTSTLSRLVDSNRFPRPDIESKPRRWRRSVVEAWAAEFLQREGA